MICFLDRSFCNPDTCQGKCSPNRRWTQELKERAEKWWGGKDAPVAFCDYCGTVDKPKDGQC